jgi:hypothetical protein
MQKDILAQMEGMFLIMDHGNVQGLRHWADELERRGMPAVIQTNEYMLSEQSGMIKNVCDKEFEICGAYNEQPFWDKPYSFRNEVMGRIKDKLETCTGKPMRIFGSK